MNNIQLEISLTHNYGYVQSVTTDKSGSWDYQDIIAAGIAAYKAGSFAYKLWKQHNRVYRGSKLDRVVKEEVKKDLFSDLPEEKEEPRKELPVEVMAEQNFRGRRFTSHDCSRAEEKYFDSQTASTTSYASGTSGWTSGIISPGSASLPCWLTGVTQGPGGNQRIGNVINVHSIQFRITVTLPTTAVAPVATGSWNGLCRIIMFSDQECDGAYPTTGDLLEVASLPQALESPLNVQNFGRWKILMDRTFEYASPSADTRDPADMIIYEFKKLNCHQIQWDDSNANAIANARNGHIFWCAIAQQTTVTSGVPTDSSNNPPHIRIYSRIRFQDN